MGAVCTLGFSAKSRGEYRVKSISFVPTGISAHSAKFNFSFLPGLIFIFSPQLYIQDYDSFK